MPPLTRVRSEQPGDIPGALMAERGRKRGTGQIRGDGEAWGSRVQRFELVTTGEGL